MSSAEVDALLRELGADVAWEREMAADRVAESIRDPWEGCRVKAILSSSRRIVGAANR